MFVTSVTLYVALLIISTIAAINMYLFHHVRKFRVFRLEEDFLYLLMS